MRNELDAMTIHEAVRVVLSIERKCLFKSMTTKFDNTKWQDVYHVPHPDHGILYVKLQYEPDWDEVVISFKKK